MATPAVDWASSAPTAAPAATEGANPSPPPAGLNITSSAATRKPRPASTSSSRRSGYGQPIQFVDMTNKKEAQTIRNTMNSRKYRQSKLDRIRELEQKLAACQTEMDQWKMRVTRE